MDNATFLIRYPEFTTVDSGLLTAALAEAALSIDVTVYGAKSDVAQGALCAHLLWTGAAGNSLRLTGDAQPKTQAVSLYWKQYARLRREVTVPFQVL